MRLFHDFERILPMVMDVGKDMRLMYNYVVVGFDPDQNLKTHSGIYAPLRSVDRETAADYAPRVGTVVKLPNMLYYDKKNFATSMRWKTDIELEIGDQVWMNHLTVNDFQFKWEGKHYKLVLYEDIVCAKRGDGVVMVNGYILCEPISVKKKALVFEKEAVSFQSAKIKYIGKPNAGYQDPKRKDPEGLNVGDVVLFDKKSSRKVRYLESNLFLRFDGKPYLVIQGYMVAAILD